MKSPVALPGVTLPNGVKLRRSKIRGVVSNGMLCSAVELGLGEESNGIISLPPDAPVGTALADYLGLPDAVFDVDLTPNRGDCFSVLGISRDIAALTGADLRAADVHSPEASADDNVAVELVEPAGCPVFAGRVVRNIDATAKTPLWMVERLRRAGMRPIHPVVDVTNYVMLEFGQPLHGYDFAQLKGTIRPRFAKQGESLVLLDEKKIELQPNTMVVTDDSGVIGLAGIMGGLSTAVSAATRDVYFEAAFWPPDVMAGRARSYGLHTDASLRFERGVDPTGQGRAVDRATELLLEIAGGNAGPLRVEEAADYLPQAAAIELRSDRLQRLLGVNIPDETVGGILHRLGLAANVTPGGWTVTAPSYRFDLVREADLIEEVARIFGYDNIPEQTAIAATALETVSEARVDVNRAAQTLIARDYQEVITYSFVDANDDLAVSGSPTGLVLSNPISSEMSVMRSSLWSGMLHVASSNLARQQERIRLFEIGKSFHGKPDSRIEVVRIAGLVLGPVFAEQWAVKIQPVDFFDIKSDLEALLQIVSKDGDFEFAPVTHSALQPGQAAEIRRQGEPIGVIGKLHPNLQKHFGIKPAVYVFELDAAKLLQSEAPLAKAVSRFPAIRRDLAIVVNDDVTAGELVAAISTAAPALIREVRIFDVYHGPGIEAGLKSVAIGLILQETSRTLTDEDADAAQAAALQKLHENFAAVLRD
jgi:phenylalanyl-tRNA synthetase beta chain